MQVNTLMATPYPLAPIWGLALLSSFARSQIQFFDRTNREKLRDVHAHIVMFSLC